MSLEVTLDTSSKSSITANSQLTFSHTCAANAKILIVSVDTRDTASGPVTGVTYGGISMTKVRTQSLSTEHLTLFVLLNPKKGANNVVVTCSSSQNAIEAIACSFKNHATQVDGLSSNIPTNNGGSAANYGGTPTDIEPGLATQKKNEKLFMALSNNNSNQSTNASSTEIAQQGGTSVFITNDPIPSPTTGAIRVNDVEGNTRWIFITLTPSKGNGIYAGIV